MNLPLADDPVAAKAFLTLISERFSNLPAQ